MRSHAAPRILEIGQFCLLKRSLPAQTTMIFTGDDVTAVSGLDCRIFAPRLLPRLMRALAGGRWDLVFCHVPPRPVWDRGYGLRHAVPELWRRLRRPRTLGTRALRGRIAAPLVLLDFNDEPGIPAHALGLLDRAVLYFKRELPSDPVKAFFGATRAQRTHAATMASPFVRRNLHKLRPISAALNEETARLALQCDTTKDVDVFFAGSLNSTLRTAGYEVLRKMQDEGYRIDFSAGGLAKQEYLARCARAWLTLSPEGYGWECFRHYEASLCTSVPVLSPPGILRHAPLRDGVHALYYAAEGDDLRDVLVRALADKPALQAMACAAREHVLRHHTHARIVEHMLDAVRAIAPMASRTR